MNLINVLFGAVTVYASGAGDAGAGGGDMMSLVVTQVLPMVGLLAVFYFILIAPQRKKDKALKAMVATLKIGDEIVTIGGIHGKVVRIKDDTLVIESGAGVDKSKIRVDRSAVAKLEREAQEKSKPTPTTFEDDDSDDNNE